ncbi:MAG: hypothetical protein AAF555_03570 [Verrucomicrobiota bacterium]
MNLPENFWIWVSVIAYLFFGFLLTRWVYRKEEEALGADPFVRLSFVLAMILFILPFWPLAVLNHIAHFEFDQDDEDDDEGPALAEGSEIPPPPVDDLEPPVDESTPPVVEPTEEIKDGAGGAPAAATLAAASAFFAQQKEAAAQEAQEAAPETAPEAEAEVPSPSPEVMAAAESLAEKDATEEPTTDEDGNPFLRLPEDEGKEVSLPPVSPQQPAAETKPAPEESQEEPANEPVSEETPAEPVAETPEPEAPTAPETPPPPAPPVIPSRPAIPKPAAPALKPLGGLPKSTGFMGKKLPKQNPLLSNDVEDETEAKPGLTPLADQLKNRPQDS